VIWSGRTAVASAFVLVWLASPVAQAAVPVEEMSTSGGQGQITDSQIPQAPVADGTAGALADGISTPQPVLPEALSTPAASGGYPGYESGPTQPQPLPAGSNAQLFYELQQLQAELLQLRGVVENQAFEIRRLQDLQRSQYLDIDRRLTGQGLESTAASESLIAQSQVVSPTAEPVVPAPIPQERTTQVPVVQTAAGEDSASVADAASVVTRSAPLDEPAVVTVDTQETNRETAQEAAQEPALVPSEQEAYARAFGLMKDQQFEQSIAAYKGVINEFPDGSYAPESSYWLGELYLMSNRLEDARGSFNQVVDQFPAHQKVPLSLYKLGVVSHRLGGTSEALTYLDDVVVRYPDTPAAGLARTYAAELR